MKQPYFLILRGIYGFLFCTEAVARCHYDKIYAFSVVVRLKPYSIMVFCDFPIKNSRKQQEIIV